MRTTVVVGSKGQIVIPAKLRKRYGMNAGSTVHFQEDHGRLLIAPSNYDTIFALGGSLPDFPLEQDLQQERQSERNLENLR